MNPAHSFTRSHPSALLASTMCTNSQVCPSRSSKLREYMKPRSCAGRGVVPPAATALSTSASTSARLWQEKHTSTSEVLVCFSCQSRAEVDALVDKAVAAGGTTPRPAQDLGFMYSRSFDDLDGHTWEFVHMVDASKALG